MDLSQEQRQLYMQIFSKQGGKENKAHELSATDVAKVLNGFAKAESLLPTAEEAFRTVGKGKEWWTKPEFLRAMHIIQQVKQEDVMNSYAVELQSSLESQLTWLNVGRATIRSEVESRQMAILKLKSEIQSLNTCGAYFDNQYVQLAEKSQALQKMVFDLTKSLEALPSPRSDSTLSKLNELEETVLLLERQYFALVPQIDRPETKTTLAVLAGKTEEIQAKKVDAIQSLGLTSQVVILARRRCLAKRLDVLGSLARTLHQIANDKV